MTTPEHQPQISLKLSGTIAGLVAQTNARIASVGNPENAVYFGPPPSSTHRSRS